MLLGLVAVRRSTSPAGEVQYGRPFGLVVLGELVLLFLGLKLLRLVQAPPELNVAWISFVMGLHFVAFGRLWHDPGMAVVGLIQMLLGVGGLTVAATAAVVWVPC